MADCATGKRWLWMEDVKCQLRRLRNQAFKSGRNGGLKPALRHLLENITTSRIAMQALAILRIHFHKVQHCVTYFVIAN
jgi:hypothetical protein